MDILRVISMLFSLPNRGFYPLRQAIGKVFIVAVV